MKKAKRRRDAAIVAMPAEIIEAVADHAAKQSCRDAALVSSVVWVPHEHEGQSTEVWVTYVTTSEEGIGQSEFHIDQVVLGPRAADRSGDQAEAMRQELAVALRRRFDQVHVCDTEVSASKLQAKLWPGERSRKIEAETIADYASRPKPKADPFARMVMQWPMLPADEPLPLLRGRVMHTLFRHDPWCRTLNGGTGWDCNCNPEVTRHLQPKDL